MRTEGTSEGRGSDERSPTALEEDVAYARAAQQPAATLRSLIFVQNVQLLSAARTPICAKGDLGAAAALLRQERPTLP